MMNYIACSRTHVQLSIWRDVDLRSLPIVLVLARELVVSKFVQDLADALGGLGQHGLDGNARNKVDVRGDVLWGALQMMETLQMMESGQLHQNRHRVRDGASQRACTRLPHLERVLQQRRDEDIVRGTRRVRLLDQLRCLLQNTRQAAGWRVGMKSAFGGFG